jgi:HEAT repeat protein
VSLFPPSRTITLDAALRDLEGGTPKARVLAAHALADAGVDDHDRAIAALIRGMRDDRADVRAEAAAALGSLLTPDDEDGGTRPDPGDAISALADRLTDGDMRVRQNAAIALGSIGDPAGFPALAEVLRDGAADVRFQAATSIAEIDPIASYDPLVAALTDPDPQVIAAAALSLGAIGDGRAVGPLSGLLDHSNPAVRFDASYALAELGDPRGREVLAKNLLTEPLRAWDAVMGLEWIGGADDARALAGILGVRKADPNVVLYAAGAILRIAPDGPDAGAARRVLLAGLAARKLPLRGLAVEQLATAGGEWAIAPLQKLVASRKGAPIAAEITDALRQIHDRAVR